MPSPRRAWASALDPRALGARHGGEVDDHLAAEAAQAELAGKLGGGGEVRLEPRGGAGVAAGVDVDRHEGAGRLDREAALAERHRRPAERVDLLPDAGVGEGRRRLAHRVAGLAPVAERRLAGAGRLAEEAGRAGDGEAGPDCQEPGDVGGDGGVGRVDGDGAHDEPGPGLGVGHGRGAEGLEGGAAVGVAQAPRHVHPGGAGGEDGVAGLQDRPGRNGLRLARLGRARDLHEERPAGGRELRAAQKAGAAGAEVDHDAAHALHRPGRDGAEDRVRPRGRIAGIGVDEDILEPAVHHERGSVAARGQRLDQDLAAPQATASAGVSAGVSAGLSGRMPAAARRPRVSVSGRPTTLE